MKIAFYTLGCKVNQFETQALSQICAARGHTVVPFSDGQADAYIINTCTVTAVSDKKCRQIIRHVRANNPNAIIAVCGCYPQRDRREAEKIGGIDIICGTSDRRRVIDMVENFRASSAPASNEDSFTFNSFEVLEPGNLDGRTRALLKVQDGCNNFCSYCIIPYTRGRVRSLPISAAEKQAAELSKNGFCEIVLTGIEISSYGIDLPGKPSLIDLIESICKSATSCRIRLGSLEPRTIDEDFCIRLCKLSNICPHFHLSLQSGCDKTLSDMNRKYSSDRYFKSVSLLRKYFPGCAIATDLIVGFPGETDDDFYESLAFIEKCRFSFVHIFPYSRRSGTAAAKRPDQITRRDKELRAKRASLLCKDLTAQFLNAQVGSIRSVLFERQIGDMWCGHTENYCEVRVKSGDVLKNHVEKVHITAMDKGFLTGKIV